MDDDDREVAVRWFERSLPLTGGSSPSLRWRSLGASAHRRVWALPMVALLCVGLVGRIAALRPVFLAPGRRTEADAPAADALATMPENRSFSLLRIAEARAMLNGGGLTDLLVGEELHEQLARDILDLVNTGVLRARAALLEVGYDPSELPLNDTGVTPPRANITEEPWLQPNHAHPKVWRLAVSGGPCAGKSSGMPALRRAILGRSHGRILAFATPELATIFFSLGAMNHGTFRHYEEVEYRALTAHVLLTQIAFEEIWARGADAALRRPTDFGGGGGHPGARAVIFTDRDALDAKAYTKPADCKQTVNWEDVLHAGGALLGRPDLTQAELVRRYQLGVLFLQSIATLRGRLNPIGYNAQCIGERGSNAIRRETVEEAARKDELMFRAYAKAYPEDKICHITNDSDDNAWKASAAADCVWLLIERAEASARQRA